MLIRYENKFFYFFKVRKFYLARFVKNHRHSRPATGNFTVAQGHLWIDGGFFNQPTGLKLSSGAVTAADWRGDRTTQAGALRTKYLLLSGPAMFRYDGERQSTNQTEPALFALDDTGALQVPGIGTCRQITFYAGLG